MNKNDHPADQSIRRRGLMLVLSSPSGAGKSSISRAVLERDKGIVMSVSYTTRPPRPGEVEGKHYHFVHRDRFNQVVAEGGMLEHARVFDHHYGTPRAPVEAALAEDRLMAEAALLATKGDVAEEIERLRSHIAAARTMLAGSEAMGRRLDFLCQEFNREANTLCSKAADLALTSIGLELKASIEQFREQVQNVE